MMKNNYKFILTFFLIIFTSFIFIAWKNAEDEKPVTQKKPGIKYKQTEKPSPVSDAVKQKFAFNSLQRTSAEQKISSMTLELIEQMKLDGVNKSNLAEKNTAEHYSTVSFSKVNAEGKIFIYINTAKGYKASDVTKLLPLYDGYSTAYNEQYGKIEAWVYFDEIKNLAAQPFVRTIDLIIKPWTNTGTVNSQGDACLKADVSRTIFNASGSGIKVGVLSDGATNSASSQSTGNLPSGGNFTILPGQTGSGDEGTAMCEIVYDIVPSAQIYFATAFTSEVSFANNITALGTAGCRVITDDVIYFDEPVFEDGLLATTINTQASTNNVVYTSSSGNQADGSYYSNAFNPLTNQTIAGTSGNTVHNFNGSGDFQMSYSGGVTVVLNWSDQYGASNNNFDLYVVNSTNTTVLGSSTTVQNGNDDPYEIVTVNTSGAKNIIVKRTSGTGTPKLKITLFDRGSFSYTSPEYNSIYRSTFGHANANSCLCIGAINAQSTNYNTLAYYSSCGPMQIDYPSSQLRLKPDLACFDGVSITGAGGFPNPFYGTSAAAPHAAGVAAQILSLNSSLTYSQVHTYLKNGAVDYGNAGYDSLYGYGRVDTYNSCVLQKTDNASAFSGSKNLSTALSIPDNNTTGITDSVQITAGSTLASDSLWLTMIIDGHSKYSDLVVTLTSPDGFTRTVMNRPGNSTSLANYPNVVLGDASSTAIQTYDPGNVNVSGFYTPYQAISQPLAFDGRKLNGYWKLNVSDRAASNTGTLKYWGIYSRSKTAASSIITMSSPSLTNGSTLSFNGSTETAVDIVFTGSNNTGSVAVARFDNAPSNASYSGTATIYKSPYRWVIQALDGFTFTNANVRFNVSQIPESGIITPSSIIVYKRSTPDNGTFASQTTSYVNPDIKVDATSFSEFVFGTDEGVLPVELAGFSSAVERNNVKLSWTTLSEQNNSGFDIERKLSDAAEWNKAGSVTGAGNTSSPVNYNFSDNNIPAGKYNYRLKQIDLNGNYKYFDLSNEVSVGIPARFSLSQNYPNPFNPATKINYDLPFDSKVSVKIFDVTGREIAVIVNQLQNAGYYSVYFNASNLGSGIYFYSISAQGGNKSFAKTMKMVLIK